MAQTISKTVTISDGTTELEIPARIFGPRSSNDVTSFARPKPDGGEPERRALNMNRIKTPIQIRASVTDRFAAKNHNGSGNRPNLDNKEDWLNEIWKMYTSATLLDLKAVNDNTHANVSEFTGYLHNLEWKEKAGQDNSVYDMTIKFQEEIKMNS